MKVLVTGSAGFLGKNLCSVLRRLKEVELFEIDAGNGPAELKVGVAEADVVYHLAGVNRPERVEQFEEGNANLTRELLAMAAQRSEPPKVVLSSSIQAERDNPYGRSKRGAEAALKSYCEQSPSEGVAYRLKNLFGKWCRPNYNSVVATLADAIASDRPYQISDPANAVDLCYVDDVVAAMVSELHAAKQSGFRFAPAITSHQTTLGELVALLQAFRDHRKSLFLPDYSSSFVRALYATYLSYVRPENCAYQLEFKSDARGSLAEFIKAQQFGQIFISRTKPGVTRGNHFHHTKTEKFMVVEGEGKIRLRQIHGNLVIEFLCRGEDYRVVDIPPGFTHSIENVGKSELVTLFWANEVFDPASPDTVFEPVSLPESA